MRLAFMNRHPGDHAVKMALVGLYAHTHSIRQSSEGEGEVGNSALVLHSILSCYRLEAD